MIDKKAAEKKEDAREDAVFKRVMERVERFLEEDWSRLNNGMEVSREEDAVFNRVRIACKEKGWTVATGRPSSTNYGRVPKSTWQDDSIRWSFF